MPENYDTQKLQEYNKRRKASLLRLQSLPLQDKVFMPQELIDEAVALYGGNHVYLSFSGGKDSTVLSHIARIHYPDILHVLAIHPVNIQKP